MLSGEGLGLLGEVELAWSRSERGDGVVTAGERRCMAREVVAAFQGVGDACLSPVQPEGTARGQTVGARGRFGPGCDAWAARWHRRRTAPPVGVVQGKQRREERDAVGGNFVISSKFKISSVNLIFLPLLGLK